MNDLYRCRKWYPTAFACIVVLLLWGCHTPASVAERPTIQPTQAGAEPLQGYPEPDFNQTGYETAFANQGYPYPAPEMDEAEQHEATQTPSIDIPAVPFCGFTFVEPNQPVQSLQSKFAVSPPEIIRTNRFAIQITGWLPNRYKLLITEDNGTQQLISTLDTETGETESYVQRLRLPGNPVWLNSLQGVVYAVPNSAEQGGWALKYSRNIPGSANYIHLDISSTYIDVTKYGEIVTVVNRGNGSSETVLMDTDQRLRPLLNDRPVLNRDAVTPLLDWSSDDQKLVQSADGLELRIVDVVAQLDCQVDLTKGQREDEFNPRVGYAAWSPDSRYLGFTIFSNTNSGDHSSKFAILDYETGEIFIINRFVADDGNLYPFDIYGFAWAADSLTLIVHGDLHQTGLDDGASTAYLLYVDVNQKAGMPLLQDPTLDRAGTSLSWSSDGSRLVYSCPTSEQGQICLIRVTDME